MTLGSAVALLFLVMDPFGNVPFFVAALKGVDPERRRRVVVRELLVAYAVMIAFLFAGQPLLAILGISEPALTIAGGDASLVGISSHESACPCQNAYGNSITPHSRAASIPYANVQPRFSDRFSRSGRISSRPSSAVRWKSAILLRQISYEDWRAAQVAPATVRVVTQLFHLSGTSNEGMLFRAVAHGQGGNAIDRDML